MARHILFTSQKGGVGKSTLARSTAVALAYAGRKVLLADFDVEQRTCLRWQVQRQARGLEPTISVAKFSKEAKLDRASDQCDDVVIDTRGQHDTLNLDLAMASDVIFLPSSFSLDDISPTLKVVEGLRSAGIPSWRVAVVFCRTGVSARQAQHARSILEMNDILAPRCRAAAAGRICLAGRYRPHWPRGAKRRLTDNCDRDRSGPAAFH